MESRRRVTLYDQMSESLSSRDSLAGLTLDDVLANQKRSAATPSQQAVKSRTLLDIIREDENLNKKDRRSWKAFKDKLRLKRAGSAWTSSIPIPTSDIPILNPKNRTSSSQCSRHPNQTHSNSDVSTQYMDRQIEDVDPTADSDTPAPINRSALFSRRSSTRYGSLADTPFTGDSSENAGPIFLPQLSGRNSTSVPSAEEPFRRGLVVTFRDGFDDGDPDDDRSTEIGRPISAREAVAAQEASEAAAAAEEEEENSAAEPMKMSLMDLLEESDRQMGFEGSRYIMGDEENFVEDDEEGEEEDEDAEVVVEYNCCVCMVRHKGSAFIPCGHTFCRLCSRELLVSRGNCPLCNNFILEILDIF